MTEGYDDDQLKFRAQHGALVWEKVRIGNREVEARKRDGWITRLIASLTPPQQDAMVEIEMAFISITAGVGMKNFDPMRLPGARHLPDSVREAERVADYFAWVRECMRLRISHAMAMAIIVEGYTGRQVDSMYRQRNGTAMRNIRDALNVFCKLRGWPTHNAS